MKAKKKKNKEKLKEFATTHLPKQMMLKGMPHTEIENDNYHSKSAEAENLLIMLQRKSKANNEDLHGKIIGPGSYILIIT